MINIKKITAFLIKDFKIEKYYRMSFLINIISLLFTLIIFFFINKFFINSVKNAISISYFDYIFASFIIFNYSSGASVIMQKISSEINYGTFEFIANSENSLSDYLLSLTFYNFIIGTLEAGIYFTFVLLTDAVSLNNSNFISVFIITIISNFIFSSVFIIASSFTVIFKRGNILLFFTSIFESILGGVYFPVNILPVYLQKISVFIPIYYSINAMQKALYENAGIFDLIYEIKILILFLILLFPLSIYIFKKSIYTARKLGNLGEF